jgi:hypothetical protein
LFKIERKSGLSEHGKPLFFGSTALFPISCLSAGTPRGKALDIRFRGIDALKGQNINNPG